MNLKADSTSAANALGKIHKTDSVLLPACRIKSPATVGELNQQLMDSIKAQDARMVGELLRQKASANFKDEPGLGYPSWHPSLPCFSPSFTFLPYPSRALAGILDSFWAVHCRSGSLSSDVHRSTHIWCGPRRRWSPLHRACSARMDSGDLGTNFIACNQIIEILIKAGADVNQTNRCPDSPPSTPPSRSLGCLG